MAKAILIFGKSSIWGTIKFALGPHHMYQKKPGTKQTEDDWREYSALRLDVKNAIHELEHMPVSKGFNKMSYDYYDGSGFNKMSYDYYDGSAGYRKTVLCCIQLYDSELTIGCIGFTGRNKDALIKWAKGARNGRRSN
jgi:hypothetical protein